MAHPGFRDYLAGGFLGNAPAIFLVLWLIEVEPNVFYAPMIGGAMLVGFLVATTSHLNRTFHDVRIGVLAGLLTYALAFPLSLILLPRPFPDHVVLPTYSAGGGLGGLLYASIRHMR